MSSKVKAKRMMKLFAAAILTTPIALVVPSPGLVFLVVVWLMALVEYVTWSRDAKQV